MPRQTRAELETLVNMLRGEIDQTRRIYNTRDHEIRSLKEENEKLKKDLDWTRRLVQDLTGIMQRSSIRER